MKRVDIIDFAAMLNPHGTCVEVGVRKAKFAQQIAKYYPQAKIFLVDPYKEFPKHEYKELGNHRQQKQDKIFEKAKSRMAEYGSRIEFIRKTSQEAVQDFADDSLAFVYIDANHSYEHAKADIEAWYKKVKPGGILAGHDYYNSHILNICGVKRAVEEFMDQIWDKNKPENGPILMITDELIPSWFFLKFL